MAPTTASPATELRGAETIVKPGPTSSYNTSSIIVVEANNVAINGFTIQGSNSSLSSGGFTLVSGTTVYAAAGISNSTNVSTAGQVGSTTDISGLDVEDNIVQDFTQVGVDGDKSVRTTSSIGNTIAYNLIQDIPNNGGTGGFYGEGVIIYDNFYANIHDNKIMTVRTGIQTGNNNVSAGLFVPSISDNIVSAYVKGIFYNLQYQMATGFTISGNTITQQDGTVFPVYNVGLLVASIQNTVSSTITNNDASGFRYGVEFYDDSTSNTVKLQGGTLDSNKYGVWDTNNDYFYGSSANSSAILDGVTITNSTNAGMWVDSTSANSVGHFQTVLTASLILSGTTTSASDSTGMLVDGGLASATILNTLAANVTLQSSGTLYLHGADATINGLSGASGLVTNSGSSVTNTLTIKGTGTFGGQINNDGTTSGVVAIHVHGGTETFNGSSASTYSGGTTVDTAGTLTISNDGNLGADHQRSDAGGRHAPVRRGHHFGRGAKRHFEHRRRYRRYQQQQ